LGFAVLPLDLAGYVPQSPVNTAAPAGLMNLARHSRQSLGTPGVAPSIARRSQYHQSVLAEHTASGGLDAAAQFLTNQLAQAGSGLHDAGQQAWGRLYGVLQAQAATLAYVDVFWLLAVFSA